MIYRQERFPYPDKALLLPLSKKTLIPSFRDFVFGDLSPANDREEI
jgi:hypothetical protein